MEIASALAESAKEIGWSTTTVAYEAGVSEDAARKWMRGTTIPRGDHLLILVAKMPGLHDRLFPRQAPE